MENNNQNLGAAFQQLFGAKLSGTGEEELLRLASTFSVQLSARQVKTLVYLYCYVANAFELDEKPKVAQFFRDFVLKYIEYKQFNNSDIFVMRALDSIALRKFMNENTMKIQVQK